MHMLRSALLKLLPSLVLLLLLPAYLQAAEVEIDPLTNNTDVDANDIHITFSCSPGKLTESDPKFKKETDTNPVTLKGSRGAVVAPGDTLTLSFEHDCNPPPKIRNYYWTSNGNKIGMTISSISMENTGGMTMVSVPAQGGMLHYYLPEDLRAGDTISGTVIAQPDNPQVPVSTLSGVVLADQEIGSVPGKPWTIAVPATVGTVAFLLKGDGGRPVSLPVGDVPAAATTTAPDVPGVVQSGSPVQVSGSFDGRLDTTHIEIGNKPVDLLAESPREAIFVAPASDLGPSELTLNENGTTTTMPIRVVGLNLSADMLNLKRGETTGLHITVTGLEGLDQPLDVQLLNRSPSFVHIEGGDQQTIRIKADDVAQGKDTYSKSFRMVGVQPGSFDIKATLKNAGDR